eukprot:CAMPEP_0119133908 /NCGR_PEP_ID=MMETSP1310-20130426/14388_1 /TAXON_ID=464262 /ORGANISM="Genus nov. species nov., Strain RCC2339" /LENGTH=201 /DNA_ID=CAMNT_0007124641 /DNA_START=126 /DNA_END=728 /DNA_ORIENTATION=-
MTTVVYVACILGLLIGFCENYRLNAYEGTTKCFIEDIPEGSHVLVKWNLGILAGNRKLQPQLTVKLPSSSPTNKRKERRDVGAVEEEGSYSLISHTKGEHEFCFSFPATATHKTSYRTSWGLGIEIEVGRAMEIRRDLMRADDVSDLSKLIRFCIGLIKDIHAEQSYYRTIQEDLLEGAEGTYSRLLYISVSEMVALILVS